MSRGWLVSGRVLGAAVLMGIGALGGALDTARILILTAVKCAVQAALDVYWRAKPIYG